MLDKITENLKELKDIAEYERKYIQEHRMSEEKRENKLEIIETLDEIVIPSGELNKETLEVLQTLHRDIIRCLDYDKKLRYLEKVSRDRMNAISGKKEDV